MKKSLHLPHAFSLRLFLQSFVLILCTLSTAQAQMVESDLGAQNAAILVLNLMGPGVSASNVTYQGGTNSAGTFSSGVSSVGFNAGIILSTGSASGVVGNAPVTSSTCNGLPGSSAMAALAGTPVTNVYDATVLAFDFIPTFNNITFRYVFSSEEYNKYVGSSFNDVFGFFINGVNVALIPATTTNVSTNNVNNCANPGYFIDNIGSPQGGSCAIVQPAAGMKTTMNGLTTVLTVNTTVNPGVTNHIELSIADIGDCRNDSNVFIEANSFSSGFTSTPTPTFTATNTPCGFPGITCTPTPTWTLTYTATPGPTDTPCGLPGNTCTFTSTWTMTATKTFTATPTYTTTVNARPSDTFTVTSTPTITPTPTNPNSPTNTATPSPTRTATNSPTVTWTGTSTSTATDTATASPTNTPCGWPGNTCTSTPTPAVVDIFSIDKNIFSPGTDKSVSIYVGYSSYPGEYSLRIYNTAGEHIQTLDRQHLVAPINKSYLWDGKNKNGDECASGVYVLYLVEPYAKKMKRLLLVK